MKKKNQEIFFNLKKLCKDNQWDAIRQIVQELHPADLAGILPDFSDKCRVEIFRLLDSEQAALVLNELDPDQASRLLQAIGVEKTSEILDEMSFDDAADLLGELPERDKNLLLDLMEDIDAEDVQELMDYPEDTAGGIMTTEYVAVRQDITVAKAIDVLRETAPDAETVYYVYVISTANKLVGVISLRELILADPGALIEDVMNRKVISVDVLTDQEEVAGVVSKYDLLAVPVVDQNNSLLGIVTVDDVIDVITEEATEDIYRLAGASEEDDEEGLVTRVFGAIKSRLPWLLVTLIGGLISGRVLKGFAAQIDAVVALAFFIPLLTGMGGNVGTQSSTITVRGLATGHISPRRTIVNVARECLVGASVGLICGSIVALVAVLWQKKAMLGLVVGLAMWANIITAATIGTLVPLVFKRLGVDPAVASAPFISTTIDITGLLIYSTLATLLLKYLL